MDGLKIAIIGSPWLRDKDGGRLLGENAARHEASAKAACEALGRELARADCRLFVYSAEDHSIEPDVVKGYLTVRKDTVLSSLQKEGIVAIDDEDTGQALGAEYFAGDCVPGERTSDEDPRWRRALDRRAPAPLADCPRLAV